MARIEAEYLRRVVHAGFLVSAACMTLLGCAKPHTVVLEEARRPRPKIEAINHDKPKGAKEGETVVITLKGDEGLRASAAVPGIVSGSIILSESESEKGTYVAPLDIRPGLVQEGARKDFQLIGKLEVSSDNYVEATGPALTVLGRPKSVPDDEPGKPSKKRWTAATANEQLPLPTIYFGLDKFALAPEAKEILTSIAEKLRQKEVEHLKVRIDGHCDERGTSEYNMALGDLRATSAKNYLISLGIGAERLRTISYGEERPAADGHEETAWAKNRRAELAWED